MRPVALRSGVKGRRPLQRDQSSPARPLFAGRERTYDPPPRSLLLHRQAAELLMAGVRAYSSPLVISLAHSRQAARTSPAGAPPETSWASSWRLTVPSV